MPGAAENPPCLQVRRGAEACRSDGPAEFAAGGTPADTGASWQRDGSALTLRTGRYGFSPLCYYADAERCVVSPSLPALLAKGLRAALDDDALAVFLRLGFMVGEDTVFEAIKVVPPNARIVWTEGRLETTAIPYRAERRDLSRNQAIGCTVRPAWPVRARAESSPRPGRG